MKLKFAKFYQGCDIGKAIRMHIKLDDTGIESIEAVPNFGIVVKARYTTSQGHNSETVLVPFPNVAYARIDDEEEAKPKSKKA